MSQARFVFIAATLLLTACPKVTDPVDGDPETRGMNRAPVADDLQLPVVEDVAQMGKVPITDPDGNKLTYSIVSAPRLGILELTDASTGAFKFTPHPNANGTDSFSFKASDGTSISDTANVSVTISAVNDKPTIVPPPSPYLIVIEDTPKNGTLTATDVDSDAIVYSIVSHPTRGTINLNPISGTYTYTPNNNANGGDSFVYRASDSGSDSDNGTININILGTVDNPTATEQYLTTEPGYPLPLTLTAFNPDSHSVTFVGVTQPIHGVVTGFAPNLTYHPPDGFTGNDSFTFRVTNGVETSAAATIHIIVAPSDAPVAPHVSGHVSAPGTIKIQTAASDPGGLPIAYRIWGGPYNGFAAIDQNGEITFNAHNSAQGMEVFSYLVNNDSKVSRAGFGSVWIDSTPVPTGESPNGVWLATKVELNRLHKCADTAFVIEKTSTAFKVKPFRFICENSSSGYVSQMNWQASGNQILIGSTKVGDVVNGLPVVDTTLPVINKKVFFKFFPAGSVILFAYQFNENTMFTGVIELKPAAN